MATSRPPAPRARNLILRALRLHCPNCGGGSLFRRWLLMRERCPTCGIGLERAEHGYFTGAWMLNIVVAELALVTALAAAVLATWPDVPWRWLTWGGALLMAVLPVATFPFTRTLWLACDLLFRPPDAGDFAGRY